MQLTSTRAIANREREREIADKSHGGKKKIVVKKKKSCRNAICLSNSTQFHYLFPRYLFPGKVFHH